MKSFLFLLLTIPLCLSIYSNDKVSLTFAGDLMAHDVNYRTNPLSAIYDGVREVLENDDLSFLNLEFPIDEDKDQTSYPSFNAHPGYVEAAVNAGFDIFSLANNHTNDYGYTSVVKTIENMDKLQNIHGISYSGLYKGSENSLKVETIQVKGLKVGFLAVTQFNNNYWNEKGAKKVYTVNYKNQEAASELIEYLQEVTNNYDCFILSYHGGAEYVQEPSTVRKVFFQKLVDAGVDIVWGHHPHVLQPWQKVNTEDGDKLIIYSMGNFLSGQLAIVDPVKGLESHELNFSATGISALFKLKVGLVEGKLTIEAPEIEMIANVRNENRYFIAVNKETALEHPMDENWKAFYIKMFDVGEHRIREYLID